MNRDVSGLVKPLKLGRLSIKNRIWNSPLWTRTAHVDGEVSDRTIAHYEARARGGCGVISTEACAVDEDHHWITPQIAIWDDKFLPGHRRLVEAIHAYNTPIICQIHHSGMFGTNPVSPSGVPCADLGKVGEFIQSRELTIEEIEAIRDKFIAAACRAQAVGYDGVEVHGATAYLLEQFFSPHNNHRTDKYGGSLEGRMQLAIEIIAGIRAACGPDFIVGYCGADCDWVEGGITRDQTSALVVALEKVGLSYFDLQTDGTYETFHKIECSAGYRRQPIGQFDKTAYYKSILSIPVTTRGSGEYDPEHWNAAFLNDECDAIRLGKQILADPDTPNKAVSGDWEAIRTCIKCGKAMIVSEFETDVDVILVGFGIDNNYFLQVTSGNYEPCGLLPLQFPSGMETVEAQKEDVPRDMECYVDADGNTYDFAYGLNWSGVIKDERVSTYSAAPLTSPESITVTYAK